MLANAQPGRIKLYGVVRDSKGCPKFDYPYSLSKEIANLLTEQDIKLLTEKHGETWLLHIQQLLEQH